MALSTYSFLDLSGSISHPTIGSYLFTGEGVGDINISMSTDRSAHDVASDGSVMVSKIAGNNGTITITAQQTSPLHFGFLIGIIPFGICQLVNGLQHQCY